MCMNVMTLMLHASCPFCFCQILRAVIPARGVVKDARTHSEKAKCDRLKKDKVGLSVLFRWSFATKVGAQIGHKDDGAG